jgi:hypothetical protein
MPYPTAVRIKATLASRISGCWLALTLLLSVAAPAGADVTGSSDYAGFSRFPGSEIVDFRLERNAVYALALGRMQRAAGTVAPSSSERVQGTLRRITYQIPDGFDGQEVYAYFRSQLLQSGQSELFACQGRGCGSSNFWANDQFNNRILYGPETSQYYLASTYQSQSGAATVVGYAALYVVTRANRRLYAHIDFLELEGTVAEEQRAAALVTPEALLLRLEQDGVVVVSGVGFDETDTLLNDQGLQLVADALRRNSLLRVYLVGHLQGEQPLSELLQRSLTRAERARERLVTLGVDAGRIEAQGVGPLAPYCRPGPCSQRLELVVQ